MRAQRASKTSRCFGRRSSGVAAWYIQKLFDAKALKWRKEHDKLAIYSIDGDGAGMLLAPDLDDLPDVIISPASP